MNAEPLLKLGMEKLEIEYNRDDLFNLKKYIDELSFWNKKYGLVKAEGRELIIKHIFDSLAPLNILKQLDFITAADAGSGAGLPGIPLALFLKGKEFTLIERSAKRAGFLRNAVSVLGIGNRVRVLEAAVEDVTEHFDVVVFRAFRQLNQYYPALKAILNDDGVLFAYKGKRSVIEDEIRSLKVKSNFEIIKIDVPFLQQERHILKLL